ncbi:hypothetical protein BDP27DRAFT_1453650 [Rhodocollybia butyracea]|uniref:Uncharacterized protein n=1 Tax=Rhodocollybia butyracea TaxID=206335 RepID=A0A9P5P5Y4_9AGAR|nr:hypothetical protein BDP27DRAFT_1453650 [Rhodocollybia butyracea]
MYILKDAPIVEPLPADLEETVHNCVKRWDDLQDLRMTSRLEKQWRSECMILLEGAAKDKVVQWLDQCLQMGGELDPQVALAHFLNIIRLPVSKWDEYLQAAQVQLVQEGTRYQCTPQNSEPVSPHSSELLQELDLELDFKEGRKPKILKDLSNVLASVLMKRWTDTLTKVFLEEVPNCIEQDIAKGLWLETLEEMKGIPESRYQSSKWQNTFKGSELAQAINKITSPNYLVKHACHRKKNVPRYRIVWVGYYALGEVLGLLQERWTPKETVKQWEATSKKDNFQQKKIPGVNYTLLKNDHNPSKLVQTIFSFENLVPLEAFPTQVYLLLSAENFTQAWNRTIAPGLDEYHFDLEGISPETQFDQIRRWLRSTQGRQDLARIKLRLTEPFQTILDCTVEYFEFVQKIQIKVWDFRLHKDEFESMFQDGKTWTPGLCKHCFNEPPINQCVQDKLTTFLTWEEVKCKYPEFDLEGAGISCAPRGHRVMPVPPPQIHNKDGSIKEHKPITNIYHPIDDLHLMIIEANQEIINRCGRHIVRLIDSQTNQLHDFIYFNAFPVDILDSMVTNNEKDSGVKALNRERSEKMLYWSRGDMVSIGSRIPKGGAKGTSYDTYRGMVATSKETICLLFDHARDSLAILESARSVDSTLVSKLKEVSKECNRLGISGANIYRCQNYQAPVHNEIDASQGLCAQLWHKGKDEWLEWGFFNLQLGYLIKTQSNTLWSFDSSHMHGTNLPSQESLITSNQWHWNESSDNEEDMEIVNELEEGEVADSTEGIKFSLVSLVLG